LVVVFTHLFGECRLELIIVHFVRLLLSGSLTSTMASTLIG
jgi:hypothetical protein